MGLDSLVRSLAVSGVTLASSFAYHQPVLYSQDQPKTEQKEKDDGTYDEETIKLEGLTQEQIEEYAKQIGQKAQERTKTKQPAQAENKFTYEDLKKLPEFQWPKPYTKEELEKKIKRREIITFERAKKSRSLHLKKKYVMQELKRWGLIYDKKNNPEGIIDPDRVFFLRKFYEESHSSNKNPTIPKNLEKAVIEELKHYGMPTDYKHVREFVERCIGSTFSYHVIQPYVRGPPGLAEQINSRIGMILVDLGLMFDDYPPFGGMTEEQVQQFLSAVKVSAWGDHYGTALGVSLPREEGIPVSAIDAAVAYAGMFAMTIYPVIERKEEMSPGGLEWLDAVLMQARRATNGSITADVLAEVMRRAESVLKELGYEFKPLPQEEQINSCRDRKLIKIKDYKKNKNSSSKK